MLEPHGYIKHLLWIRACRECGCPTPLTAAKRHVEDRWRGLSGPPFQALWDIYHCSRCTVCKTHRRLKWKACVCACVWGALPLSASVMCLCARSSVHACCKGIECVTARHHWSGWEQVGERLREIREAVIRECFLGVSLLKDRTAAFCCCDLERPPGTNTQKGIVNLYAVIWGIKTQFPVILN